MRKSSFYPRLALVNLARNGKFYLPYLLTIMGTAAAYYIAVALAGANDLPLMTRYAYLSMFMSIGTFVIALFSIIFLTYTNSFLMKRRKKELGLYNILGLGKGNLAVVLGFETLYTAAAGIGGGILLGVILQKLVTLLLYRIMDFGTYYGFYLSGKGMAATAVLFGLILLGNLLVNLHRIRVQNPMELMREGSAGEREPKTRRLTAAFGVLCLGGGYGIAVTARDAMSALSLYFLAVFLVIIGTYCLFTAVSIVVLKALRRNRRFYYQTRHFIGVSGMLYRMKRNAVGLANICILSTMVLVMVSGTLSLYLGSEDAMRQQFPGNVAVTAHYDTAQDADFDGDTLALRVEQVLAQQGLDASPVYRYGCLPLYAADSADGYELLPTYPGSDCQLCLLTEAAYTQAMGGGAALGESTAATLRFPDGTALPVTVRDAVGQAPAMGGAFASTIRPRWVTVADEETLDAIDRAQRAAFSEEAGERYWRAFWQVDTTPEVERELPLQMQETIDFTGVGGFRMMGVDTQTSFGEDFYALNGGFFFLGLFLGVLFIMATVLIIYYKQLSEGYEDRERYHIMQKVGMEERTVRHSINSQILVVFFAPLLVAAVHVAFDYGLVVQLLGLFSLYDGALTLWCTVGTFAAFCGIYALVYWATARAYYKIVQV